MPFNPSDATIKEVKEYVRSHDIDPKVILEQETRNKDRDSLVEWLENRVEEE